MGSPLPFVDAHVHFWKLDHIRYPWLAPPFSGAGPNGSVERIAHDYLLDDYLADAADFNVHGIVHVEAGAHPDDALKETDWLQGVADASGGLPDAIVAQVTLDSPAVGDLLTAHARRPNVRGVRQIVSWHRDPNRTYTERDLTLAPAWELGFALLGKHGLSFDLQAYPGQFRHLARLIAKYPDIPVIINHAGMMVGESGHAEWRAGMTALADLPHVAVKISGIGFAHRPWSYEQARRYVLETIDRFGTDRVMFASDFPTDSLFGTFEGHIGTYARTVANFSEIEQRAMFAGNANRIYRLGLTL